MRDNGILDDFWETEEEKPVSTAKWKRGGCKELDDVFGIEPVVVKAVVAKPAIVKPVVVKAVVKPVKKRKRRAGFKKVKPDEAASMLAKWEQKLLKARKMVQKYRTAVKRYKKQGKI
jgi:hypothetical protein